MKMKKYLGLLGIAVLAACTGNNQSEQTHTDTHTSETVAESTVNVVLADNELQQIYDVYIALKDKLVATDYEQAKNEANNLLNSLKDYKGNDKVVLIVQKIAEANDIATQRREFTDLNTELIKVFKEAAITEGTIYVQHCPMANKGDGGDWLSSKKQIENPYYGDEMMACGAVIEEIKIK